MSPKMLIGVHIYVMMHRIGTSCSNEIDGILQTFIVNFTDNHYGARCSVTAFVCAHEENVIHFSKFMSDNGKLHEIVTVSSDHKLQYMISAVNHRNFYVVDLDCIGSRKLLSEANANEMFVAPNKWLLYQDLRASAATESSNITDTTIDGIFEGLNIFPDSEVIISQRVEDNTIKLLSMYRVRPETDLIIEDRGKWDNVNGIQLRNNDITSRRRTNLMGIQLKASLAYTNKDTLNHLEDFKFKEVDAVSKMGYTCTKLLAARMNTTVSFTYTLSWGYKAANGTWDGMVGEILKGDADLGATGTFITATRLDIISYIQLYTPNRLRFVFKRPPLSHVRNLFTLPFTRSVWISGGIFCGVAFVILYLSLLKEWDVVKHIPSDKKLWGDLEMKPAFGDNFLIVIGAVTQQGSAYEPRTIAARLVILMLLLLCLNLYAAYTANIVALLQSTSDSIRTLKDLMDSPLKLGLQDVVYNRYYMGKFEDPLRKEFYERRIKDRDNVFISLEEGIKRMRHELFAIQTDTSMAYDVVQRTYDEDEKCGFEEMDYMYIPDPLFIIKKNSPYEEIFRVGALWVEEAGLKDRVAHIICRKKPACNNRKKFVSVGTIECYAAYLTIGYGMLVTVVVYAMELVWYQLVDRARINNRITELEEDTVSTADSTRSGIFDEEPTEIE